VKDRRLAAGAIDVDIGPATKEEAGGFEMSELGGDVQQGCA
jgi:hypothetical protein